MSTSDKNWNKLANALEGLTESTRHPKEGQVKYPESELELHLFYLQLDHPHLFKALALRPDFQEYSHILLRYTEKVGVSIEEIIEYRTTLEKLISLIQDYIQLLYAPPNE